MFAHHERTPLLKMAQPPGPREEAWHRRALSASRNGGPGRGRISVCGDCGHTIDLLVDEQCDRCGWQNPEMVPDQWQPGHGAWKAVAAATLVVAGIAVAVVLVTRVERSNPASTPTQANEAVRSAIGESCARTADCVDGATCVGLVCRTWCSDACRMCEVFVYHAGYQGAEELCPVGADCMSQCQNQAWESDPASAPYLVRTFIDGVSPAVAGRFQGVVWRNSRPSKGR